MSTGTADDGQTPQHAPEDLVRVREAAPVVGGTPSAVHAWIKRGRLTRQSCPAGRQVSRAAVHALCAPCGPLTPLDGLPIFAVARTVGVSRALIASWMRWGLLLTWEGRHGTVLHVVAVRALAQQRGRRPLNDDAGE